VVFLIQQSTPNRPNRRPTDHVHMVVPYFEGAESISGLVLPQVRFFRPHLQAETWLPDLGHDPQVGSKSGPQSTPTDAQPTPNRPQPTPDQSRVNVVGPWGAIPCGTRYQMAQLMHWQGSKLLCEHRKALEAVFSEATWAVNRIYHSDAHDCIVLIGSRD